LPQPQRFEKPGPAITANADFVRSNFGAGLMLWHQKESAERKVAHRDQEGRQSCLDHLEANALLKHLKSFRAGTARVFGPKVLEIAT
jgi:hypothetical protein